MKHIINILIRSISFCVDLIYVTRVDLIDFRSADQQFNHEQWANALALCEWCGIVEAVLHDGSET